MAKLICGACYQLRLIRMRLQKIFLFSVDMKICRAFWKNEFDFQSHLSLIFMFMKNIKSFSALGKENLVSPISEMRKGER